ncbi:MAG: transposase family protein [Spirochaetaceae bacterium]|nr:transposase family protein [Spirochaetaceae bacterium]
MYPLHEVIVITIPALIAPARGREDTGRYAKAKKARLGRFLKPGHGVPHYDVYRRVISRIAPREPVTLCAWRGV